MASSNSSTDVSLGNFEAAILFNGTLSLVFFLLFLLLRPKFPSIYASRLVAIGSKMKPRELQATAMGVFAVLTVSDKEMIEKCGQDAFAACFYTRTMARLFIIIGIPGLALLIPINVVGSTNSSGMDILSFSNVDEKTRVWAHLCYAVYVVFATVYTIFGILAMSVQLRASFLERKGNDDVAERTLMIRDVPKEWRNGEILSRFFGRVCPGGVEAVVIPKVVPKGLAKLTAKQLKVRDSLETAVSSYFSQTARHFNIGCDPESDERINPDAATSSTVLPLHKYAPRKTPVRSNTNLFADSDKISHRFRPTHRVPAVYGKKVDSIEQYSREFRELEMEGGKLRDRIGLTTNREGDGNPVGTAFIVFKEPYQAHLAAQVIASNVPLVMAEKVPNVDSRDVIWQNINAGYFQRQGRGIVTKVIMFLMIIFWGALVALVLSLVDLPSLGERVPVFQTFLNNYPTLAKIVGGVLPSVIVSILLSLVPPILRLLSVYGGSILTSKIESEVFSQYYGFQICNVFAVNVVGSSIFSSLAEISDNPSSVVDILAHAVPGSANFFIQYLLVLGLTGPASELLQLSRLLLTPIMARLFGKTPRAVFNVRKPPVWTYSTNMAVHGLAVAIGLVYSVIAPIVLVFAALYFGLHAFVDSYMMQFVYVVKEERETGGRFLFVAANHIFLGLFIMEFMVWVLFIVSKNIGVSVLMPLAILFTLWAYEQAHKFRTVIDSISLQSLLEKEEGGGAIPEAIEPGSLLIRWLFPGLAKAIGFARIETEKRIQTEKGPNVHQLYCDQACGFTELNVWIPKCGVWGLQSEVSQEVRGCGKVGIELEEYRVRLHGAGVSEKGTVEIADGLFDASRVL
ncbi:hypothetical protein HDU98_003648 [Podochytrium sp. JEL0797]|nr:hypothetical protein HDU98_003648 [Podochytrium sp. JEL0797]